MKDIFLFFKDKIQCNVKRFFKNCHVERVVYIDVLVTCTYLVRIYITWASFVGLLCAVCLSSLCIAHEKTCLESLFIPPSLSLSFPLSSSFTLSCRFLSTIFVLGVLNHHLPPSSSHRHIVARFVPQLLYKLLMTAKPNRETERTCSTSRNYQRKLTLDLNVQYSTSQPSLQKNIQAVFLQR